MPVRIRVCATDDIEEEDVMRFDHGDKTYAIIHGPDGNFYATDGWCTHEKAHLAEGIVDEFEIECPLHFGAFSYRTGDPKVPPVCVALKTHKVVVEDNVVFLEL